MNMRQKRELNLMKRVIPVKKTIKDWYYHVGMKFINSRQFKDEEEAFLEEITEFFVSALDNIECIERRINEENKADNGNNFDSLTKALLTEHYNGSPSASD